MRQPHLEELAEQLRTIAARLARADYSSSQPLYVSLHLQVRTEAGPDDFRQDLVREIGSALYGADASEELVSGTLRVHGPDGPLAGPVTLYTPNLVCGQQAMFWPDQEAIDARCTLPLAHEGVHRDDPLAMEWEPDGCDDPCAAGCSDPAAHAEGGHDV